MVEANLNLVRSVASWIMRKNLPPSIELDDLVQAGSIGLVKAAERYDPAGGASFRTFARYVVRGAILDSIRRHEFEGYIHEEMPAEIACVDPIEERIAVRQEAAMRSRAIGRLPVRRRKVIELRYGGEATMTMVKVGAAMGVGKVRAIQLHQDAIGLLRADLMGAAA